MNECNEEKNKRLSAGAVFSAALPLDEAGKQGRSNRAF